ncbi:response regulator [Alteromonas sp. CYL-A6]|uniref:response regulator n=1 Tax=Alteromonas nitratireducens TaxID=3390813 RepID=UPI0034AF72F9
MTLHHAPQTSLSDTSRPSLQSLLIIDDDTELTALLSDYLTEAGYRVAVEHDGQAGLAEATCGSSYDLILLDVMMPKMDGFDVLKRLRTTHTTPVLMLTARGDDYDRILGLELGADDYLPKPFNHRELVARIRAFFRRQDIALSSAGEQQLSLGGVTLCHASQSVAIDGAPLQLTGTEFAILHLLMLHAGQRVTKQTISEKALGKRLMAYDRSIDMHVSNLRKKMAEHSTPERIKTIRGAGYLFVQP